MKIGIVGQRKYANMDLVAEYVATLPKDTIVVTGGAKGVDEAAAVAAREHGLQVVQFYPDLKGCKQQFEYTRAYFARNQQIVDEAERLVAFTDQTHGGTWDTVKRGKKRGIPVLVIHSGDTLGIAGKMRAADEADRTQMKLPGLEAEDPGPRQDDGKPPAALHMRNAGLGVFACRARRHFTYAQYADIVQMKDNCDERLVERILKDFLAIYEEAHHFGFLDLVTMPPRSERNLGKRHPMEAALSRFSQATGIPFVAVFRPWDKKTRGYEAFGKHTPTCTLAVPAEELRGKVILLCDDVITTGTTMKAATRSLIEAGAHVRGLAWFTF